MMAFQVSFLSTTNNGYTEILRVEYAQDKSLVGSLGIRIPSMFPWRQNPNLCAVRG